jgi:hypothetical protein
VARDNFTEETKRKLGERVNLFCSNPECRVVTKGPHESPGKATSIGEACHIHAASPDGPRFDPSQNEDERCGIDNGIWLCSNCSAKVDADPNAFPADRLREWKRETEQWVRRTVGKAPAVKDEREANVDRLRTIPVGTALRLAYQPLGRDHVNDQFRIRHEGVDVDSNVFKFVTMSGGSAHGRTDAMPLVDVQAVWKVDETWVVRASGYLDHTPLAGHLYKSRMI